MSAVAGLDIHRLEKIQLRVVGLQLRVVVNITYVQDDLVAGDVTGDGLIVDRKLYVLEGVEAGLDLGDDRVLVFADDVYRQPVGVEQVADLVREFDDELIDVLGRMDLIRDRLQFLLERQLSARACRRREARFARRQPWPTSFRFAHVVARRSFGAS